MAKWKIVSAPTSGRCANCNKKLKNKAYVVKRSGIGGMLKSAMFDNYFCTQACFKSKHA